LAGRLAAISIGLAACSLAVGYALDGEWLGTVLSVALGFAWLAGHWRRWDWMTSLALPSYAAVAAVGLSLGVGSGWMLTGLIGALIAWDLGDLLQTGRSVDRVDHARELENNHLRWILVVGGLGLALAALAMSIRVRIGFAVMAFLALLLILALSLVVRFLRPDAN
jgi:hypothetical protein